MNKLKSAALVWPARVGAVTLVAAAGLMALPSAGQAAAASGTASPSTGSAGNWISVTTTTANTFRDTSNAVKVGNTNGTINPQAVQFSTTTCPTTTGAIPVGAHTINDLTLTNASTSAGSANSSFNTTFDSGKTLTATGVAASTTITASGLTTSAATLSAAATATVASPGEPAAIGTVGGPYWSQQAIAVTGTKLSVKAPAYLPGASTGTSYNICVYDSVGNSASVLASATFKAYTAPTITTVSSVSGPSQGGNSITISGTGFTAATKATVGGVALTNLNVNATSGTITGTVPSGTGTGSVVVTSEGGSVTYGTTYTWLDGLTATPQTLTPNGSAVLDIYGAGFQSNTLSFADYTLGSTLGTVTATNANTDVLTTSSSLNLPVNTRVKLGTVGTNIGGVTTGGTYWVKTDTGSSLTLSLTPGGRTVDITGTTDTIGALYNLTGIYGTSFGSATPSNTNGNIAVTSTTGLVAGDVVRFTGVATTTNITNGTPYYVVTVTNSTTFTISATSGGSVLVPDADGTATSVWRGADSNTHIVVALGAYDPAALPNTAGSAAAECTGAVVLSDTELVCNLVAPNLADGSYQVAMVDNPRTGAPDRASIVSSGSSLTSASY